MPSFVVNEIEVDVAHGSGELDSTLVGDRTRSIDGSTTTNIRAWKDGLSFSTPVIDRDDAEALRRLLRGDGHNFRFADSATDYYSKKGLAGTATLGGGTITAGGASGKFDKRVTFSSATPYLSWTPAD